MRRELVTYKTPKASVSETFRTLRTNIQFMSTNKGLKTLLVTSTMPGEGKSWVSANLAVAFAQAGKRVVLVDSDMRKGRQYSIFGTLSRPGLSNYLSGMDSEGRDSANSITNYIQETEVENLFLIPAGSVPPNPSELLVSNQMINMLNQLKQLCDLVILDGTPTQLVTDSVILSRLVDATLIVTSYKETKIENLDNAKKSIENVGGNIVGVVLNKFPISLKKYDNLYYGKSSNTRGRRGNKNRKKRDSDIERMFKDKKNANNVNTRNIDEKLKFQNSNKLKESINVKDDEKVSQNENKLDSKTESIINQINKYLDDEKNKLQSKGDTK